MTDRGKTFSPAMVRAIVDGRKTQTRRLASKSARSQAGAAGDRIYVREHWKTDIALDLMPPRDIPHDASVLCLADHTVPTRAFAKEFGKHRQAMHMPRWASRITLIVSEVRIEPLHSISRADCVAEGVSLRNPDVDAETWWVDLGDGQRIIGNFPEAVYRALWDSLHDKPDTRWNDNPDVIVTTFSVVKTNIDKIISEGTAE